MESDDGGLRSDSSLSSYSLPPAENVGDVEPQLGHVSTSPPSPDPSPLPTAAEHSTAHVRDTPFISPPTVSLAGLGPTQTPAVRVSVEAPTRGDTEVGSYTPLRISAQPRPPKNVRELPDDHASKDAAPPGTPRATTVGDSKARRIAEQSVSVPPTSSRDLHADGAARNEVIRPTKSDGSRVPSHIPAPSSSSRSTANNRPASPPTENNLKQERGIFTLSEQTPASPTSLRQSSLPTIGVSATDVSIAESQPTITTKAQDELFSAPADTGRSQRQNTDTRGPIGSSLRFTDDLHGVASSTPSSLPSPSSLPTPSSSFSGPQAAASRPSANPSRIAPIDVSTEKAYHPPTQCPASGAPAAPDTLGSSSASTPPRGVPPPFNPAPMQQPEAEEPEPATPRSEVPAEPTHSATGRSPAPSPASPTPIVTPLTPPTSSALPTSPPPATSGPTPPSDDNVGNRSGRAPDSRPPKGLPPDANGHALESDERVLSTKEQPQAFILNGSPARAARSEPYFSHGASHPSSQPMNVVDDPSDVPRRPWLLRVFHTIICCLCFK
ncbi:hypothetical protein C8Q73DRAFT_795356 [Cubamyces lactineus]|nr:hypothetical protein C8Q73DRAFT_795356 [Cubamyces lactineus]